MIVLSPYVSPASNLEFEMEAVVLYSNYFKRSYGQEFVVQDIAMFELKSELIVLGMVFDICRLSLSELKYIMILGEIIVLCRSKDNSKVFD